jgi:NADPH:quinone reductase-like Zn-dependent oxidoreductase
VLIQGTGGVSIFGLQFAKMAGARVISTSGSDQKLERLRSMGVADLINYKTNPNWEKTVREMTGGIGVDHVVEVGGAGTLPSSIRAVRRGGHIALIGVLTGGGEIDPRQVLFRSIRLQGITVGSKAMFAEMNAAISLAGLRPVVDRVFGFEQVPDAMRHLESGAHFGKVCVGL